MTEYGASSTSFYTSAEKLDHYESLDEVLDMHCHDEKLRTVIVDMLDVCAKITDALRTTLVTVEGIENTFGDKQLSVDVGIRFVTCQMHRRHDYSQFRLTDHCR